MHRPMIHVITDQKLISAAERDQHKAWLNRFISGSIAMRSLSQSKGSVQSHDPTEAYDSSPDHV